MKEFIDIMADCFFVEYEENIAYDKAEKAIAEHDKQVREKVIDEMITNALDCDNCYVSIYQLKEIGRKMKGGTEMSDFPKMIVTFENGKVIPCAEDIEEFEDRIRTDERERIVTILKENSYEVDIDCPPYQETVVSLTDILEVLAESEIVRGETE